MKKIFLIFVSIIVVIIGVYLYIRFDFLKAKDFKPDNSKSKSIVDMRPAIIAKLRQLVKDASRGLYHLSIGNIDLHIAASSIDITNATLTPDSARIKDLDNAHTLPDDIFKISFSSLRIDGVNINDVLSKDRVSLKSILVTAPVIEVYHKQRWYNKALHKKNDSLTLYKKIMKKMKSISVDSIKMSDGTFI